MADLSPVVKLLVGQRDAAIKERDVANARLRWWLESGLSVVESEKETFAVYRGSQRRGEWRETRIEAVEAAWKKREAE